MAISWIKLEKQLYQYHLASTSLIVNRILIVCLSLIVAYLIYRLSGIQERIRDEKQKDSYTGKEKPGGVHEQIWAKEMLPAATPKVPAVQLPNLCSYCNSIYPVLKRSLISPNPHGAPKKIGMYRSKQIEAHFAAESKCALCNLALSILSEAHDTPPHLFAGDGFSMWAVNVLNGEERRRAVGYGQEKFISGIYVRLNANSFQGEQARIESEIRDMSTQEKVYRRNGLIMPVIDNSEYGAHVIDAWNFEFNTAKSWISQCSESHSGCRARVGMKDMAGFKVMDCQTKDIIKHDCYQPYLALSYVWGKHKQVSDLEKPSEAKDYPRVITDAIETTKRLGYRYLWVDRYCIDQKNDAEKAVQIAQMDLIYENAELTIVAAAGGDDTYGIPGVSNQNDDRAKRKPQPAIRVGDMTFVSSLPDIPHYMSQCKWATRGWTYQEALLSRRCLIFTKAQTFFACQSMCRSETLPCFPHLKEEGVRNLTLQTIFQPEDLKTDSTSYLGRPPTHPQDDDLRYHAKMFSTRALSNDNDALAACTGILKRASTRSYFGVPVLNSQASGKNYLSYCFSSLLFRRKFSLPDSITAGFCLGLLWYAWDPEETNIREGFPSWSWLSIKNDPIDFRYTNVTSLPRNSPKCLVKVWVGDRESMVLFSEWAQQTDSRIIPGEGMSILIEGPVTPVTTLFQESGERFARFRCGMDSVVGELSIDCDIHIPEGFFPRHKWITSSERKGKEVYVEQLGWIVVNLLDMRSVVAGGALEYLVLKKTGSVYKRVGIMRTDRPILGMIRQQIQVE